jgi:hypothetical protein
VFGIRMGRNGKNYESKKSKKRGREEEADFYEEDFLNDKDEDDLSGLGKLIN